MEFQTAPVAETANDVPDTLALLAEATEAFRALLTPEVTGRLLGTPGINVGWRYVDERTMEPVVTVRADFGFALPGRYAIPEPTTSAED